MLVSRNIVRVRAASAVSSSKTVARWWWRVSTPSGSVSKASAAQLAQRLAAFDGVDRPIRADLVALEDTALGEEADHAVDILIVRRVRVAADLLEDGETVFGGHGRTIADFGTRIRVGDPLAR